MRTRATRVIAYFSQMGIYDKQFDTEAEFLKHTNEFLNMLPNTKAIRMETGIVSGKADILVCCHGRFIALELKDNTGKPAAQQLKFIEEVRNAGGTGRVVRTLKEIMETLLEAQK